MKQMETPMSEGTGSDVPDHQEGTLDGEPLKDLPTKEEEPDKEEK